MIGKRLHDLRIDADLTQQERADILRINKHSVSAYENEKSEPPDAIKIAIAKHFGVSVEAGVFAWFPSVAWAVPKPLWRVHNDIASNLSLCYNKVSRKGPARTG